MSYIMVINNSAWPLHGALSWAGIQQQCFNNLSKNGNTHDFVVGAGWHDLTIVPGTKLNKYDENKNNSAASIGNFMFKVLSLANPAPLGLMIAIQPSITGDMLQLELDPNGKGSGDIEIRLANSDIQLKPVTVTGLYASDGYNVTVSGGEVLGTYDKAANVYTITKVNPLALNWENRTSHTKGQGATVG
ncbi:MAG TPA: hypothetical protein VFH89_12500 [Sphingomicrobium sp.]|nr:hypothetical protein [Sphingomicrobium sp.]